MLIFLPMKRFISLGFLIVFIGGCSFFHHPSPQELSPRSKDIEARILQKSYLFEGRKLLIVPFVPGEAVTANNEFDRISLMIVKGVAEVIQQSKSSPFTVLVADNASHSDVKLKGHVMKMKRRSVYKRWITWTKYKVLAVEGKLVDSISGQEILSFRHTKEGEIAWEDLALAIGEDVGNFLLNIRVVADLEKLVESEKSHLVETLLFGNNSITVVKSFSY